MALPTSGPLTLAQIQTEFGGSNPISLSEYYAGGANVPAGTSGTNGAVPSSGTISIANFYGTQKVAPTFTFSISAHQDRANLRSLAVAAGWNQSAPVVATLTGGYYIYSTTTQAALTIDGSWPGGVTFVNNGYVMGLGGNGGGYLGTPTPATNNVGQTAGSDAIALGVSCTIQNNSYIGGGGGGGGCGGIYYNAGGGAGGGTGGVYTDGSGVVYAGGVGGGIGSAGGDGQRVSSTNGLGGGGGGGRIMPGASASSQSTASNGVGYSKSIGGGAGNAGSYEFVAMNSGGTTIVSNQGYGGQAGGTGGTYIWWYNAAQQVAGGGGGGWGASGGPTISSVGNVSATGAAGGFAVRTNGYSVTWSATGTRYGSIG